jgi:hypothetical protein
MKKYIFLFLVLFHLTAYNQEMESDLFESWTTNSLQKFIETDYKKMTVETNRSVKGVFYTELFTTYKKSKFNQNKINYNIQYTEHYIIEDRKKSNGKIIINDSGKVVYYERTDIGPKNKLLGSVYDYYGYRNNILIYDKMRFKEYVNVGAVEFDTIISFDSLVYKIKGDAIDTLFQVDQMSEDTYSYYVIIENRLVYKTNIIMGYSEIMRYSYDVNGNMEMIVSDLVANSGDSSRNVLKLFFSKNGLLIRTEFYDKSNALLEEKIFSYK